MKSVGINFAKTSTLGLAIIAAIISPVAMAADNGWYVGANIGQSRANIDDEGITRSLLQSGATSVSIQEDNRDLGYKIQAGYQFNRYLALEGGYFNLGKFSYTANTVPAGTLNGNIRIQGINLDAVGMLPLTQRFSALGRIGVNHAQSRDSFTGTGAVQVLDSNPRKTDTNYKFGVGVQYALNDALAMRAEAERYRIDDAVGNKGDVDLFSLGLIYRFGGTKPAPQVVAVNAPQQAAAMPAPVPQAVIATQPPAPRKKVAFSADSLFDFDKASIKPDGRLQLDKLAEDLKGTQFRVIKVTGHSDRIGTHDYNMKLSTQRAEAVKAYLVDHAGLAADKITATGVNGAEPVTSADTCVGDKATKALIDCLQPDRRVEVEVDALQAAK
ncbi:outer membrane beta-barrel protein [Thermithiobacillus plumbiphilus]|uniref:Outer membrane beta-barrel protein n=1 Tax=Thermithiobacillus plumbiphilus TaxID=1729899 RepID=A0ABU9DEG4_9PROT